MRDAPVDRREEAGAALSVNDVLHAFRRRMWVILAATILAGALAIGFSIGQTPMYEASIKILVGQNQNDAAEGLGSEIPGLQQLTQTMTQALQTRPVAQAVIEQQGLRISPEQFLENLTVEQVANTQFIEVAYKDANPQRAKEIADAIGEVFSEQVSEVSPSANAINATLWERAAVPVEPVSPNFLLNTLLAMALGLLIGVGIASLLEYLDDSWNSPEEVERISGVPTLGVVPEIEIPKATQPAKKKEYK